MTDIPLWLDLLVAVLLVLGGLAALIGAAVLLRMPTSIERLHGPTLVCSTGGGLIILGLVLLSVLPHSTLRMAPMLVMGLLLFTAPLVGQALTSALRRELPVPDPPTAEPTATRPAASTEA